MPEDLLQPDRKGRHEVEEFLPDVPESVRVEWGRKTRTKQKKGKGREAAVLLVLSRPAESLQNGVGFRRKAWTIWACRIGKSGIDVTKWAVGKNAEASFAKTKRNRAIRPNHDIVRWERINRRKGELTKEMLESRLEWWKSTLSPRIGRKTPVLRLSTLCGVHSSRYRGGGGPDGQVVSIKRAANKNR